MKKAAINIASGGACIYMTYSGIFQDNVVLNNVATFAMPALAVLGILASVVGAFSGTVYHREKARLRGFRFTIDLSILAILAAGQWYFVASMWLVSMIFVQAKYEQDMEILAGKGK